MCDSQPTNINDHLDISKPVRKSYIKNGQHKKFSRQKYIQIDYIMGRGGPTLKNGVFEPYENESFEKFNFKKTTARKYQYSCGGYGGRCSNCKMNWW